MRIYDSLPVPLRQWLTQAVLPWSPSSAKHIWMRARQRGLNVEDALETLNRVEAQTLVRDQRATGKLTKHHAI